MCASACVMGECALLQRFECSERSRNASTISPVTLHQDAKIEVFCRIHVISRCLFPVLRAKTLMAASNLFNNVGSRGSGEQ